ncbi:MAG: MFS transporter [Chloroflexi bacterium]|nr:MFS transporter [Chloroflexota bacterium]
MPDPERRPPLLQQRPFRMLSFSRFCSRLAQNAINFGLVLLIVDETGKAFLSSLLVLALVVPSTVAGIAAGVAADHLPKRILVVAGDLARAAICGYVAWKGGGVAAYYLIAVGLSVSSQFAGSAEGAILPGVVRRHELARANAIGHAVTIAAQLAGFGALTPLALRVFDTPRILFAICGGLYVLAAGYGAAIGRVTSPERLEIGGRVEAPWWQAGWRQMRSDPAVMHAAVELTLIATTVIILGSLLPTYITDTLGLPIEVGAAVLIPGAAGMALGLRVAGFLAHRVPHGALSSAGFAAFVFLLAALAFVNPESEFLAGYGPFEWLNDVSLGDFDGGGVIAMMVVFPLGFAYAIVSVAAQTVLNDRVPLQLQGRVLATQGAMAALAASLPVLVAGGLSDLVGVTPVLALVAGATAVVAVANVRQPKTAAPGPPVIGGTWR